MPEPTVDKSKQIMLMLSEKQIAALCLASETYIILTFANGFKDPRTGKGIGFDVMLTLAETGVYFGERLGCKESKELKDSLKVLRDLQRKIGGDKFGIKR